jgi:hypothetical protein
VLNFHEENSKKPIFINPVHVEFFRASEKSTLIRMNSGADVYVSEDVHYVAKVYYTWLEMDYDE